MFVEFFPQPNEKLVSRVSWVSDISALLRLIESLPSAVFSLVTIATNQFPTDDKDFSREEDHRKTLNRAINLAEFMIEGLEVLVMQKTFLSDADNGQILEEAFVSLRALQNEKNRTIQRTHRTMGENFGSATGFQTSDYNNDIARLTHAWAGEDS